MSAGKLIHKDTLKAINVGDVVADRDGVEFEIKGWRKPHKPSSTGRVFVVLTSAPDDFENSFFPTVFDLKIVDFD